MTRRRAAPGCFATGRDMNELREALDKAVSLYLSGTRPSCTCPAGSHRGAGSHSRRLLTRYPVTPTSRRRSPGDQRRRDRVRLVVPAADRVIEVVMALQRHAAPADLVVRYVITHDNSRHRRTEPLIDAAETTQEQLEHTLEYYHVTPPPFDAIWRAGAAVPHAARMRLPAAAAERFMASSPCSTVVTRDAPGGCTAEPHACPWRRAAEPRANPCSRSPRRHPRQTARIATARCAASQA
jgi:hypothetical protein